MPNHHETWSAEQFILNRLQSNATLWTNIDQQAHEGAIPKGLPTRFKLFAVFRALSDGPEGDLTFTASSFEYNPIGTARPTWTIIDYNVFITSATQSFDNLADDAQRLYEVLHDTQDTISGVWVGSRIVGRHKRRIVRANSKVWKELGVRVRLFMRESSENWLLSTRATFTFGHAGTPTEIDIVKWAYSLSAHSHYDTGLASKVTDFTLEGFVYDDNTLNLVMDAVLGSIYKVARWSPRGVAPGYPYHDYDGDLLSMEWLYGRPPATGAPAWGPAEPLRWRLTWRAEDTITIGAWPDPTSS
ncbi:MAG: hypothetical protein WCD37_03645 [Chloroflexia bacterium]